MADQNNRVECRMIGGVCACSPGSCVVGLAAPAAATPAVPAPAIEGLMKALQPIIDAVNVNDGDTLGSCADDSSEIWTAWGSWTGGRTIRLGDLRRVTDEVEALLAASQPQATPLEATSEPDEPTARESLIACLGDDAAQLDSMELWPEMAQTMREAAAMLEFGEQMGGAQAASIEHDQQFNTLLERMIADAGVPDHGKRCREAYEELVEYLNERTLTESAAAPAPADPMDTPLPLDIVIGKNCFKQGRTLRYLVAAMRVLHGIAFPEDEKPLTPAARDVLAERHRQVVEEGWTAEHDDKYPKGALAGAAACYAYIPLYYSNDSGKAWPFDSSWFKPRGERRDWVRAAALLIAEIERLDRIKQHHGIGSAK